MHETQRAIPKKDELILQSKGAGMSGNFQEAKRLRDLAYVIGETDLESRLAKTDIDFDNNKKVLMKKQSTEIKNLAQKLNSELLSIKENTTLMIEKENELKNVRISSIYSQEFSKDPKGIRAFKEIMDRNNCQIPSGLIIPGQFIEKNIEVSQSSSKIARRKSK
ncbi:hypothetical protein GPJ56_007851 [Histomonas meleagridis]|uniref:uncharacterized protein n=1 Tax=Histomonas meleagridis TaxID=135588 RepID=UPI00355940C7|nr:hypothetical protein GPJ56_007851 [Histomonas meleagridis]KAH0804071.1 hypothetical protein GO595_002901 [Histomonas meleagridis]